MSQQERRKKNRPETLRCPVCGNERAFALYLASIRVRHLLQRGPGQWRRAGSDPRALRSRVPLMLVCEGCAHPLGAPPQAVLRLSR